MGSMGLIERAASNAAAVAIRAGGRCYRYEELLQASNAVASALLEGGEDLREERIAFLVPAGFAYAAAQWGIWRAGGIAVPLSAAATEAELEHVLADAGVERLLVAAEPAGGVARLAERLGVSLLSLEQAQQAPHASLPQVPSDRRAMILYTSGTTSKPKGVVSTHANIEAQIRALVSAWEWNGEDRIPLFLPLHHIHGIINVLGCALWAGACVDMHAGFDEAAILSAVAGREYTLFMAVPTVYARLAETLEGMPSGERSRCTAGFAAMRLMVSGSAALAVDLHRRWRALTGQVLLERYGMTEIGMALSNPLHGERRPGTVGQALPGVEVRLVDERGGVVVEEGVPGEIEVRGPSVFSEYWNRPDATRRAFSDGWFRTGDVALVEDGYYRIMGRLSVDIIKSGGYKLSALEIEDALRAHPAVRDCAVVGLPDAVWGEIVAAAVVPHREGGLDPQALERWARDRLSSYKLPRRILTTPQLPRNAMGKVTKTDVKRLFRG